MTLFKKKKREQKMIIGIYGENSKIEFELIELWGFPEETSFSGGYAGRWNVDLKSGNYSCKDVGYFSTGEFFKFGEELNIIYENLEGEINLEFFETDMNIKLTSNSRGQIIIMGHFQGMPGQNNRLEFEFPSDQSYLLRTLKQISEMSDIYGGMKGKKE